MTSIFQFQLVLRNKQLSIPYLYVGLICLNAWISRYTINFVFSKYGKHNSIPTEPPFDDDTTPVAVKNMVICLSVAPMKLNMIQKEEESIAMMLLQSNGMNAKKV